MSIGLSGRHIGQYDILPKEIEESGDTMKVIIGLGNPGNQYEGSRHNIGFDVVDTLLAHYQTQMDKDKFRADYTVLHLGEERAILVKPYTYMNLSGEAVLPLMTYYGAGLDDILVIHDDLDLPVGKLRLRKQGSSGGQRGVQNIIDLVGSNEFKRIRLGIGRPDPGWKVVDHVLAPFKPDQQEPMNRAVELACQAAIQWLEGDSFDKVMQDFN